MKRLIPLLFLVMIVANSFAQKARQHCCACYHFFSDEEIFFVRDSMISYRLYQGSDQWMETNFYTYFYDDNQKIKEHLLYVTDQGDLVRKRLNRYEYEYHKEDLSMTRVGYSWDEDFNSWMRSTLARYSYDSTFALSKRVEFTWDQSSEDWIFNYNNQFNYDTKGIKFDSRRLKWDPVQQIWNNDAHTNCSWNLSFEEKSCFSYQWQTDLNDWIPYHRIFDYYDEEGTLHRRVMDVWDQEMQSWNPLRNFYFLYDQYGRESEWLSFGWDDATGNRIGMGRQLYAYDEYGNKIETLRYGWDRASNDWILYGKQIEYWTDLTKSSRIEQVQGEFKIYPNPFEEYTTIELDDYYTIRRIEMIDMFGRKVRILDKINQPTLTLYRENLKSGLYLLKIFTPDETITLRIIVK